MKDAAPDGKAATRAAAAGRAEGLDHLGDGHVMSKNHHPATIRIVRDDQFVDALPLLRLLGRQFPPVRMHAQIVEAGHDAHDGIVPLRQVARRDEFEHQFVAALVARLAQGSHLVFLGQAPLGDVVGVIVDQAFDNLLPGPVFEHRTDRTGEFKNHRVRARLFDRTAQPPATTGSEVQRLLAIAVVDQGAHGTGQAKALFCPRHRLDQQALELRQAAFGRAYLSGQIVELAAMVEGEDENIAPLPTLGRDVV